MIAITQYNRSRTRKTKHSKPERVLKTQDFFFFFDICNGGVGIQAIGISIENTRRCQVSYKAISAFKNTRILLDTEQLEERL